MPVVPDRCPPRVFPAAWVAWGAMLCLAATPVMAAAQTADGERPVRVTDRPDRRAATPTAPAFDEAASRDRQPQARDHADTGRPGARRTAAMPQPLSLSLPLRLPRASARDGVGGSSASHADMRPITVTLTSHLDFSRLAVGGRGAAVIDPVTDRRHVSGAVTELGGMALSGSVEVTGEPGRAVTVSLPRQVRLMAPGLPPLIVDRLVTDLPSMPVLGPDGRLSFRFGGQLVLDARDAAQGSYRGRVVIGVDYQ